MTDATFARRTIIAIALIAAALMLWELRAMLLLLFASVLVAVMFDSIAHWFCRRLRISHGPALLGALLLVVGLLALAFWLFGDAVGAQFAELSRRLPSALATFEATIREYGFARDLYTQLQTVTPDAGALIAAATGFVSGLGSAVSAIALALVGGIYIAATPREYREGMLALWPRGRSRESVRSVLTATGAALRSWLQAQLVAMVAIGTLTYVGLLAIGMPSALALAVIAFLAQFVPLAGPIFAAIPALLLALTQGPTMLLWVAGLYVAIQQLEGNLITPLVQREVARMPPALTIFTLVAFGLLFGIAGIVLAVPLTVVAYTLIAKLYVRDTLHETVVLPGEEDEPDGDREPSLVPGLRD